MNDKRMEATALIATETPQRYLVQLCRHFEHRLQVAQEGSRGCIIFLIGTCLLEAQPSRLVLRAQAEDSAQLQQLQDVVGRHLVRFAFRAPPDIVWEQQSA